MPTNIADMFYVLPFGILIFLVSRKQISSSIRICERDMDMATGSWKARVGLCHETGRNSMHASELFARQLEKSGTVGYLCCFCYMNKDFRAR